MKSFVSLFTLLCFVVISSAILPVPIKVKPPVKQPPVESGGADICSLRSVTGPCRASIQRYFYNKATGSCETFTYGGCRGNANNFDTQEECLSKCGQLTPKVDDKDVCLLPPVTGMCMALFRRYFYNKSTGSCELFTYGGCQGNGNNFKTNEECVAKCGSTVKQAPIKSDETNVCSLPSETGLCKGFFPKYYYNRATRSCEIFTYGGCGGNANNFSTKSQCLAKCGGAKN